MQWFFSFKWKVTFKNKQTNKAESKQKIGLNFGSNGKESNLECAVDSSQ